MKMLTVENVSKTYGEKQLFDHISFTISEKERVGLIGINGTGKSSLLKIIAGLDVADEGKILSPKDYTISFLSQQPELDLDKTVLEQVFRGDAAILKLMRGYEETLLKLNFSPSDTKVQEELLRLQKQMDALNAWDASTNAKSILMKLGIEDFTNKIGELSGGQKKRVALAQEIFDHLDFVGNFRAAENCDERARGMSHGFAEEFQFLLDEETDHAGLALHGLRGTEG